MKSACEKRKTRVCQTYCMFSITSSVSVWRNRRNRSHRRSRAIARRSDLPGASSVHPCRGSGGDGDGGGAGGSRIVPRGSGPPSDLLLWCLLARRYQRSLLPYRRHRPLCAFSPTIQGVPRLVHCSTTTTTTTRKKNRKIASNTSLT